MKRNDFTRLIELEFRYRIILGMLSGFAIGWFLKPDTIFDESSAASPFALAFLAGYSVEILFIALDKLVATVRDR